MLKDEIEKFVNNKNLNMILDSLDEGIHIVDREGTTIAYNKKVSEIDGLEPEEVIGKNLFEVYPSLTLETSTLMQTIKTGESIEKTQQTFINTKGKRITTVNKTVPLKLSTGEMGAMEISRDITLLEELVENVSDLRAKINVGQQKSKNEKTQIKKDNNTTTNKTNKSDQSGSKKTIDHDINDSDTSSNKSNFNTKENKNTLINIDNN